MPNYNQATVIGHLGADPELRYTGSGTAVCNARLATTEKYKKDGEVVQDTTWHSIVLWGKLAEVCAEHLRKGDAAMFVGPIQNRSYEDRDGNTRYVTEIKALQMVMLGGGKGATGGGTSSPAKQQAQSFEPDDELPW